MTIDLFELMPALHRLRDDEHGGLLRSVLDAVSAQYDVVADDLDRLYDNWFVETCADWVVPYIGDLLAVASAHDVVAAARPGGQRARVANTLGYRQAKGTLAVVEALTRDTTGWPAHAVEAFTQLDWNQHLNHVRLSRSGTADLSSGTAMVRVGGPFDPTPYTVDVRSVALRRGQRNLPTIAQHVWRLGAYQVPHAVAVPAATPADGRFRIDPLGRDVPLVNPGRAEVEISHLSTERDVPGPLSRRALSDELEARRQAVVDGTVPRREWFDDEPVLRIFVQATSADPVKEVTPDRIAICDFTDRDVSPPPVWLLPPATIDYRPVMGGPAVPVPIDVGIDPATGRVAFPTGVVPHRVEVTAAYGAVADVGGGPYDRSDNLREILAGRTVDWHRGVSTSEPPQTGVLVDSIGAAVSAWNGLADQPALGLITILDNARYAENLIAGGAVRVQAGSTLVIAAARWPRLPVPGGLPGETARRQGVVDASNVRPCLDGSILVQGGPTGSPNPGSLVLSGLWVSGRVTVGTGLLDKVTLTDVTISPDGPGLRLTGTGEPLDLELRSCVTGAWEVQRELTGLAVSSSLVAGNVSATEAPLHADACTFLGTVDVRELAASDCLFVEPVTARRRQVGCARFSWLAEGSRSPRRFRCQPDLALAAPHDISDTSLRFRLAPDFTSDEFGHPAYGQLAASCADEISAGASTGGEMGTFRDLQQPQRIANVRAALDEYLPWGLESGLLFTT